MRTLLSILGRKTYRVKLDKVHCSFLYRERGRRILVPGEAMADGYAVYASCVGNWQFTPAETIDDNERQRIAVNIRNYFVNRGKNIYLS